MTTVAEMPIVADPALTKKRRSKRALKQKNPTSNEANIMAGAIVEPAPIAALNSAGKENHESLSQPKSLKKTKKGSLKAKQQSPEPFSFEKELQEMQEKLEKMKIEKEQTEELLKGREEALKQKEEEQEKLKIELKRLQKIKEFKPDMTFPASFALKDLEQEKKDKKKGNLSKKKPSPPYVLWYKDQWSEVKKAYPDADFKEMANLLGSKWKTVSAEEKKPYEERYKAEKEVHLKIVGNEKRDHEAIKLLEEEQKQKTAMDLLEQYLKFKQEAEKENKKKTKKVKDPLKPKQPMSAYFVFANERRAFLAENRNIFEVAKITGEEWKNMTKAQREPYEQIAMKNKERYAQEMEVYNQKKEEETVNLKKEDEELMKLRKQEALQLLKKKEKTENLIKKTKENRQKKKKDKGEKIVDPNKPKKPASSFLLFSLETRKNLLEERLGINNCTLNALISVKWKELGEQEKQIWKDKAAEAMEAYKKELEASTNLL